MAIITINTDECFECGEPMGEMHHVIPRSRGGTKTLPLCVECHCKVHGLKNRPEHRRLVLEGLEKAKARGVKLGSPQNLTNKARLKSIESVKKKALDNENNKLATIKIVELKEQGYSYEQITKVLNELDYKTSQGKTFNNSTAVWRIYQRHLRDSET